MANPTLFQLATTTVGSSSVSSVTFSNIPQVYTDLIIKASVRSDRTQPVSDFNLNFNGSSSAVYAERTIRANGASVNSFNSSTDTALYVTRTNAASSTANTFSNVEIYIPNYTSSNYKSVSTDGVTENNDTTAYAELSAGLWPNTSAITSIALSANGYNMLQYSTFTLYGVRNY